MEQNRAVESLHSAVLHRRRMFGLTHLRIYLYLGVKGGQGVQVAPRLEQEEEGKE